MAMEVIIGSIARIRYESGSFKIFTVDTGTEFISAKGFASDIEEGDSIEMNGEFESHPKYGKTFNAIKIKIRLDRTKDLDKVLSKYCPNVLKHLELLFRAFSISSKAELIPFLKSYNDHHDTICEAVETHYNEYLVEERDNIKTSIKQDINNFFGKSEIEEFIHSYVIESYGIKHFRSYNTLIDKYKDNPKQLNADVETNCFTLYYYNVIKFDDALEIANKLEYALFSPDDYRIAKAVLHYTVNSFIDNGNTCMKLANAIKESAEMIDIDSNQYLKLINEEALKEMHLVLETRSDTDYLYPSYIHQAETNVINEIKNRTMRLSANFNKTDLDKSGAIEAACKLCDFEPTEAQFEALNMMIESKLCILTGDAGSGKTTVMRIFVKLIQNFARDSAIAIVAPTGKAAKRINEVTEYPAGTIHRFLKARYDDGEFTFNHEEEIDLDYLIIDECSMIDIVLMSKILTAVSRNCRIILIGDPNQLPSISPGLVFRDMIQSGYIPRTHLNEVKRAGAESNINKLANKVMNGIVPELSDFVNDVEFIETKNSTNMLFTIKDILDNNKTETDTYDLSNIQILSPMNVGDYGCHNINDAIRTIVHPNYNGVKLNIDGCEFFRYDKILQTSNKADLDIYNGDIGFITDMQYGKNGKKIENITIDFEDDRSEVNLTLANAKDIILAYAVTVHKSQGSEFPITILVLSDFHFNMLERSLLYTAITRAKKKLYIVGNYSAIPKAVRNNKPITRVTKLEEKIKELK